LIGTKTYNNCKRKEDMEDMEEEYDADERFF
jgi:hypothetical protein